MANNNKPSLRKRPSPQAMSRWRDIAANLRAARAAMLDRLADQHLQSGHHHQAERLAHAAAELREACR